RLPARAGCPCCREPGGHGRSTPVKRPRSPANSERDVVVARVGRGVAVVVRLAAARSAAATTLVAAAVAAAAATTTAARAARSTAAAVAVAAAAAAATAARSTAATAAAFAATADELHRVSHDLGRVVLLALFLVARGAQAAFDVDLAALGEEVVAVLGLLPPHRNPVPLGLLDHFVVLVLVLARRRDVELADRLTVLHVSKLRVAPEAAKYD